MEGQLSLSIVEIVVLMLGAIVLGITIHFFITSRKSLRDSVAESPGGKMSRELDDWKRRYFNDIEYRDKQLGDLKKKFEDTNENNEINMIEADEMRKMNKQLQAEIETLRKATPAATGDKPGYIEQLKEAQSGLLEHNSKISKLLQQIDIVKETEEKQQHIIRSNEELMEQVEELRLQLSHKEKEIGNARQKAQISSEMNSMLDNAYTEFNALQEKMLKLEMQVTTAKKVNIEYEDMKEGYQKLSRDYGEEKTKLHALQSENNQLKADLTETEDKLKEANFQRQQLQKKVAYLEELNTDMQVISEANKKLESQIKRIGELESMLNVVAEERDDLARRQHK
jgi:chromosome segregation ATPase